MIAWHGLSVASVGSPLNINEHKRVRSFVQHHAFCIRAMPVKAYDAVAGFRAWVFVRSELG